MARVEVSVKSAEEYRREMESYFGTESQSTQGEADRQQSMTGSGRGDRGHESVSPIHGSKDELRLHEYRREPKKRVIAEALLERQHGKCNLESDGHVCGYVFWEIDHINGNSDDWTWENLQLLCEKRHRIKTNQQRAETRHSKSVRVQAGPIHYATSDASLEDIKHDNWASKFVPWLRSLVEGPFKEVGAVISYPALVGLTMDAVAYVDQWGNQHIPTEATAQRYIREECIRPKGCLQFCTRNGVKSVEFVGDGGKAKQTPMEKLREEIAEA